MDDAGNMMKIDYISLKKQGNLWEKADYIRESILSFLDDDERQSVTGVFVEENLQVFRRGLSSARTLMTLAKFNGIVCYILRDIFEIDPISINVNEARKSVGLKVISTKKGGKPTKEQVIDWVTDRLSMKKYVWPTKILKSGPRRGQTILLPECADMADAYVISAAAHHLYTAHD
jgi:hypothetical protein